MIKQTKQQTKRENMTAEAVYQCSYYCDLLGEITLACTENNLVGLWLAGQKYYPDTITEKMIVREDMPLFAYTKDWLARYFAGKRPSPQELPLAPQGGDFRQRVWHILAEIPYGEVTTYKTIAQQIARDTKCKKMSAQAVGGAVGHNPISIIIPCHRVVGSSGNLTGYAGGIDKKIKLLKHEGLDMTKFFVPQKGKKAVKISQDDALR